VWAALAVRIRQIFFNLFILPDKVVIFWQNFLLLKQIWEMLGVTKKAEIVKFFIILDRVVSSRPV